MKDMPMRRDQKPDIVQIIAGFEGLTVEQRVALGMGIVRIAEHGIKVRMSQDALAALVHAAKGENFIPRAATESAFNTASAYKELFDQYNLSNPQQMLLKQAISFGQRER